MTSYLDHQFDSEAFDLVSITDELPLWSAPFGMRLLETIQLGRNLNVLDIGCGTGFPLVEIAERLGPSCTIHGIDPWKTAVERARLRVQTYGLKNASVATGVAEQLPFEDAFFDLVVSNNGLNNVQDAARAFSEAARVSKPGAQLVMTFNLPDSMVEFYEVFRSTLESRGLHDAVTKMKDHIRAKRPTLSQVEDWLTNSGFDAVRHQEDRFVLRFLDAQAMFHHHFIKYWFLESWKEIVPVEDRRSVFGELESALNILAQRDGEIQLTIPFVTVECRKR